MIQVKFYGDFGSSSRHIQVATCDIHGTVYLSKYFDNVIGYACTQRCFWRKRLNGPAYIISPLFYQETSAQNSELQAGDNSNPFLQEPSAYDREKRSHLMAFGALERVILTSVAPTPAELVAIERPDYIDSQTVPYLDWGEGLSPSYRDRTYPILAITWGKLVQLAVWTNREQVGEQPQIEFDGFYVCDGFSID